MFDLKKIKYMVCFLLLFIIFYEPMIIFYANVTTLFRENNKTILKEKTLKREINYLKKQIKEYELAQNNIQIAGDSSLILSKISLRNIYNFYDYLVISTSSTVKNKDEVINENGLVGFIYSHSKNTAKVKLLTGNNKISVKINDSYGLLGNYNSRTKLFMVKTIKNVENIKEGDIVVTSGLASESENLYIGKVKKVNKKGIEPIIYVKSDVDFNNLNYLFVRHKSWPI